MPTETRTKPALKAYGNLRGPQGPMRNVQFRAWDDGYLVLLGLSRNHAGQATSDEKVTLIAEMQTVDRPVRARHTSGPWTWTDEQGATWELDPKCSCAGLPQPLARFKV